MNFARTIAAASVAGAALGLIPAAAASAGTAAQTGPAPKSGAAPVVTVDCGGQGLATRYVRPRELTLSCDSSDALIRLRWTKWNAHGASGHGAEAINDCTPDCAQGKFHDYPVHVNFWGLADVKRHPGEHRYTHYTLTYSKAIPAGYGRTRTGTFAS